MGTSDQQGLFTKAVIAAPTSAPKIAFGFPRHFSNIHSVWRVRSSLKIGPIA